MVCMAAGVTDINIDHSCSRTRDPEMAMSSSLDPDIIISLGSGNAGLLYWHGPSKGVVLDCNMVTAHILGIHTTFDRPVCSVLSDARQARVD